MLKRVTMADNPWGVRPVLELDESAATVFVEAPGRTPRLGGRWLVFPSSGEVWWELPDDEDQEQPAEGGGEELPAGPRYRRSIYGAESFPGKDFVASPA
jgi:hypothetical protein